MCCWRKGRRKIQTVGDWVGLHPLCEPLSICSGQQEASRFESWAAHQTRQSIPGIGVMHERVGKAVVEESGQRRPSCRGAEGATAKGKCSHCGLRRSHAGTGLGQHSSVLQCSVVYWLW